jgi:hypothetical protein
MGPKGRTVARELAAQASRRHGLVARIDLIGSGVTDSEIKGRLQAGSLIREFQGVYRVGHRAPSTEATYMAAVLACRDREATLSGPPAAYLYGLVRGRPPKPEVTSSREHRVPGVRTRRRRNFDPRDRTTWKGIPITTVSCTLVDIAEVFNEQQLAWAIHQAQVRHGTEPEQVAAVLARRPGANGRALLVSLQSGDAHITLSALERKFLARLRRERLPLPITNRLAGGRYVDCRWPEHHLTVELDSYRFHNSRYSWEQDRRRERQARARGDDFRRYTYGDVCEHPGPMMSELRAFFRASS